MQTLTDSQLEVMAWINAGPPEAVDAVDVAQHLGKDEALVAIDLSVLEQAGYLIQDEPRRGYSLPLSEDERAAVG